MRIYLLNILSIFIIFIITSWNKLRCLLVSVVEDIKGRGSKIQNCLIQMFRDPVAEEIDHHAFHIGVTGFIYRWNSFSNILKYLCKRSKSNREWSSNIIKQQSRHLQYKPKCLYPWNHQQWSNFRNKQSTHLQQAQKHK